MVRKSHSKTPQKKFLKTLMKMLDMTKLVVYNIAIT
nr:MAG TPA: hypothetical protein [Caudoviricetes sp.]